VRPGRLARRCARVNDRIRTGAPPYSRLASPTRHIAEEPLGLSKDELIGPFNDPVKQAGFCGVCGKAADTGQVRGTVQLGGEAGNIAYDPTSGRMLVDVQTRNQLAVIDPATLTLTRRMPLPGCDHTHGLSIDPPIVLAAGDTIQLRWTGTGPGTSRASRRACMATWSRSDPYAETEQPRTVVRGHLRSRGDTSTAACRRADQRACPVSVEPAPSSIMRHQASRQPAGQRTIFGTSAGSSGSPVGHQHMARTEISRAARLPTSQQAWTTIGSRCCASWKYAAL
jgi:hypothetical protein